MTTLRLSDALQASAASYADRLGISLNALVAVALADYLESRGQLQAARPRLQATTPAASPMTPPSSQLRQPAPVYKAERNEPCPCGSGRKFKVCHGAPGASP